MSLDGKLGMGVDLLSILKRIQTLDIPAQMLFLKHFNVWLLVMCQCPGHRCRHEFVGRDQDQTVTSSKIIYAVKSARKLQCMI